MNHSEDIFHDELKMPAVYVLAAGIVYVGGALYGISEIIQLMTAIVGPLGSSAKFLMYGLALLNFVVAAIVIYGLYKAKGWARGAVAFITAGALIALLFDLYIMFGLGFSANIIKINAMTNFFSFLLAAYAFYLLFSEEVAYVLGKYKIENLVLGALLGVALGVYNGASELEGAKLLAKPDKIVIQMIEKVLHARYCCPSALQKNGMQFANYPRTASDCNTLFSQALEDCRQKLSGSLSSNVSAKSVTAYMDQLKLCVRTDLVSKFR